MSGADYVVECPACKAANKLRGKAMTLALTCQGCERYFRVGSWELTRLEFQHVEEPALYLGARGRIEGYVYEVLGFVVKQEMRYRYQWREYLIFNPFRGYAFLSEYNGHWNMVWPIESEPASGHSHDDFYYGEHHYQLYQRYQAQVVYAKGEFFFDVVGITDSTTNYEYIAPPKMFALETSEDSLAWFEGEYFSRQEIAAAFSVDESTLPKKSGIGYTQPIEAGFRSSTLVLVTALALFLIFAFQVFMSKTSFDKIVFQADYGKAQLDPQQNVLVTGSFKLEGTKNLEVVLYAPVTNDWFFSEFSLINETTGTEYNFVKEIEYYTGYEDGAYWSEGSKQAEAILSQIPEGTYHFNIYPDFSRCESFSMVVRRDVPLTLNVVITCLAILAFPVFYFLRKNYREQKRWEDSDFSPYGE